MKPARILCFVWLMAAFAALPAQERRDTTALEEITVSAVKMSGIPSGSPSAFTEIGARQIADNNVESIKGISDMVPNLFMPDYGSRITSSIYVRGLGARMDQPVVGLNIDNVPVLNKDAYDLDIPDISSVVMIRGPQSTLYGRNTMGGVINITTLSPFRYQGVRLSAGYSSGNTMRYSAGWYHKFNGCVALSVVGFYNSTSGFFRNEYNGRNADPEKIFGGRVKLELNPSRRFRIRNVASVSKLLQGGYAYESVETGKISFNDTCFYRRFLFSDGLTLRYEGERISVTGISSVQFIDDNMTLDQDFLPLDYFTLTQKKSEWTISQDIVVRPASKPGSFYSWLAGAFGFYRRNSMQAPVTFHDYGISSLIENHRNESNPSYPISWDTRSFPLMSDFTIPSWSLSAYHVSTFNPGDFHIEAGVRLDYERSDLHYRSYCDTGYTIFERGEGGVLSPYRHVDIDLDERGKLKRDFLELIPSLGIVWKVGGSDDVNLTLDISKGYKAGGFNTQMFSDLLQQRLMSVMGIGSPYDADKIIGYKPEKSWNFEIGARAALLQSRLRLQATAFYIDCRDQQLTAFPDGQTTGRIMTNAGKTRSAGVELTASYSPLPDLELDCSYGFTDARFRKYFDGMRSYKGKHIPYAPAHTLFVQAGYTFRFSSGFIESLRIGANLKGNGKIYWNEDNSCSQDFYLLPGAFVRISASRLSLELWGENLSDTKFNTFYFVSIGNRFLQRGKPIRIGATLNVEI